MDLPVSLSVTPIHAQVCLVDATWQDYPQWEDGNERVAFRAPSLTDHDSPPYPGFAVATRADFEHGQPQKVAVTVRIGERPDLTLIHSSVLYVGRAGAEVGNEDSGLTHIDLRTGYWPIEIWVDSPSPDRVTQVVFVLQEPTVEHA